MKTFTVYPNPSSGIYNISGLEDETGYSMYLTDNLGRRIQMDISDAVLDLSGFAKGQYFIVVNLNDGQTFAKKVILN